MQFEGYGEHCWGLRLRRPGWVKRVVGGVERSSSTTSPAGAPFGPDDGTVAPWVVASLVRPGDRHPTICHLAA